MLSAILNAPLTVHKANCKIVIMYILIIKSSTLAPKF